LQCARTHVHTLARFPPFFICVHRAHRAVGFPPSWPPRGPSLSTFAKYSPGSSYTRPSVPCFSPRSFFPPRFPVRLLHIQSYQKTSQRTAIFLRLLRKKEIRRFCAPLTDFVIRDIGFLDQRDGNFINLKCHVGHSCGLSRTRML
jgi:hypothetical protein